jgi:hypothetical protein
MRVADSMHVFGQKCVQDFGQQPEEKRPVEGFRSRWVDSNKLGYHIIKVGFIDLDLCASGWSRLMGFCECYNETFSSIQGGVFLGYVNS